MLETHRISDMPIFVFNILTYMGVSRTHIEKLPSGQIAIKSTTGIPFFIYAVFHINSWCKGIFLMGLFGGLWKFEMEFFDYIAGLSWFLIFIEICIGDWLLMRKYPFFEVMNAGLKLQNEIHERLGERAEEYRQQQNLSAVKKVWFQWIIILMGIAACILNFASAPKYVIFTNALIELDTPLINWLMGFHDVGFIVNAWMLYGADVAIQSVFGGQLQHTLNFMSDEVHRSGLDLQDSIEQHQRDNMIIRGNTELVEMQIEGSYHQDDSLNNGLQSSDSLQRLIQSNLFDPLTPVKKKSSSGRGNRIGHRVHSGRNQMDESKYSIDELIISYRSLWLYTNEMNKCCSYNFGAIHVIAYIQMTCDVFAIFQLLRTPGSEPTDVAYFIEDCIVCMYLLFKCFRAISFVGECSENFINAMNGFVTKDDPRRTYHRKAIRSLPKIVMKLGPASCGPSTVGNASTILLNYYIMVALWK